MPTIEKQVEFAVPPERVWAVAADPARFGDWLTMHRSWQGDPPTELTEGVRATAVIALLNMPSTITWTVAEYAPNRAVRLTGTGPAGVEIALALGVEPTSTGTAATVRATFDGAILAGPIGAAVENAGRTELDASTARLAALLA